MGLLEKMAARQARVKQWSEPPFWDLPEPLWTTSWSSGEEKIGSDYPSYIEQAFKASPSVFGCIRLRMNVLSEARFKWRQVRGGQPGDLFGTDELAILEQPWPNGTTSDLLTRMEVTSSLAGNYYATVADDQGRVGRSARGNRRIVHLRPDWVTIVIDSYSGDPNAADARIVGYVYTPLTSGVKQSDPLTLLPEEIVHFAPIPDPAARFRGMSWLTPILNEVEADKAATRHKGKFFENGATPNMAVILSSDVTPDNFKKYVAKFKEAHQGGDKAYKTLFLAGGADVRPLSASFSQMDFKPLQGLSETRVAMAAGVHPTIVGMSEGLQGSSLNSGNFNAAARLVANTTLRPWWRNAAESWSTLVAPPPRAELWYDDRDIAFLREDGTDLASIRVQNATTARTLVDGGWDPDAAIQYLATNDPSSLIGKHTGLVPVQLQPPGLNDQRPGASSNGSLNGSAQAALQR
jgi:phage portal protein BeeE